MNNVKSKNFTKLASLAISVAVLKLASASEPGGAKSHFSYKIKPGDTLSAIAKRHGVSANSIASLNKINNPNRIFAGRTLNIPVSNSTKNNPAAKASPAPSYSNNANSAPQKPLNNQTGILPSTFDEWEKVDPDSVKRLMVTLVRHEGNGRNNDGMAYKETITRKDGSTYELNNLPGGITEHNARKLNKKYKIMSDQDLEDVLGNKNPLDTKYRDQFMRRYVSDSYSNLYNQYGSKGWKNVNTNRLSATLNAAYNTNFNRQTFPNYFSYMDNGDFKNAENELRLQAENPNSKNYSLGAANRWNDIRSIFNGTFKYN